MPMLNGAMENHIRNRAIGKGKCDPLTTVECMEILEVCQWPVWNTCGCSEPCTGDSGWGDNAEPFTGSLQPSHFR